MEQPTLQIAAGCGVDRTSRVVRSTMRLEEVLDGVDVDCVRYLLVEDDRGQFIGVVETEQILRRLAAPNGVERTRWMQMPLEAALNGRLASIEPSADCDADGSPWPFECTAVSGEGGVVALAAAHDVYVSWRFVAQTLFEARVDAVTGLPARSAFDRRLSEEHQRVQRTGCSLAILLIDVDHFKAINDTFGHGVGDATLHAIGDALQRNLRSYDMLARYGGDEFAAICYGCRPGEIDIPIRRLQAGIRGAFSTTTVSLPPITLSIGAAVIHEFDARHSPDDLVELADMCVYRAKASGRNCAYKMEIQGNSPHLAAPTLVESARPDAEAASPPTPPAPAAPAAPATAPGSAATVEAFSA